MTWATRSTSFRSLAAQGHRHHDNEAIIVSYDPETAEFKRIAAKSMEKASTACTARRSWSSSATASPGFFWATSPAEPKQKGYPYLPLTQADIDTKAAKGDDVTEMVPHGPIR